MSSVFEQVSQRRPSGKAVTFVVSKAPFGRLSTCVPPVGLDFLSALSEFDRRDFDGLRPCCMLAMASKAAIVALKARTPKACATSGWRTRTGTQPTTQTPNKPNKDERKEG